MWKIVWENSFLKPLIDSSYETRLVIIGIFSISWIEGLLVGSTYNIILTKFFISLEYISDIGENYPLTIFKAKKCNESASKGGFNIQSS